MRRYPSAVAIAAAAATSLILDVAVAGSPDHGIYYLDDPGAGNLGRPALLSSRRAPATWFTGSTLSANCLGLLPVRWIPPGGVGGRVTPQTCRTSGGRGGSVAPGGAGAHPILWQARSR